MTDSCSPSPSFFSYDSPGELPHPVMLACVCMGIVYYSKGGSLLAKFLCDAMELGPGIECFGEHSYPPGISPTASHHWQDVFWLLIFMAHLTVVGFALGVFGLNRFKKKDRLNIDKFTMGFLENKDGLTEDNWPVYSIAAGVGAALGWTWLLLLPFTMLVLQAAIKMVQNLLEVTSISIHIYASNAFMASPVDVWQYYSMTPFHLRTQTLNSVVICKHITTLYSCYRTLRWKVSDPELIDIRGLRSKIGKNGCLLCCVAFLFHLVEFLVRWFNKYAYVQQFGLGLKHPERVVMVGSTAMLVGMILVGLAVVVVESAVYICYAEDPTLINRFTIKKASASEGERWRGRIKCSRHIWAAEAGRWWGPPTPADIFAGGLLPSKALGS
ncbi:UNVERIFIED_CONTAM: hypothetical protein Scaly_0130200 [Sesamum calycinum]|uniref:Uncharacterized protein n=1 Tax=Sesamum calycinum TaxID=2727403 RepID=A0AAW2SWF8_9LAMI